MSEKFSNHPERRTSATTIDTESCDLKTSEGGRAARLTVAGSVLVYYASFGVMSSFGYFQDCK
jgi:hypothetical protein